MGRIESTANWFFVFLGIALLSAGILVVPGDVFASTGTACASSSGCSGVSGSAYYACLGECCQQAWGTDLVSSQACCGDACGLTIGCDSVCNASAAISVCISNVDGDNNYLGCYMAGLSCTFGPNTGSCGNSANNSQCTCNYTPP